MRGIAHITGGGIPGNLDRVLPPGTDAVVDRRSWEAPRIFGELQRLGEVERRRDGQGVQPGHRHDRRRARDDVYRALDVLRANGRAVWIGHIAEGSGQVQLV